MKLFIVSDTGYQDNSFALTSPFEDEYYEVDGEATALRDAIEAARQQHPDQVLGVQVREDGSFTVVTLAITLEVFVSPPVQIRLDERSEYVLPYEQE